jgi:hypothetical protein
VRCGAHHLRTRRRKEKPIEHAWIARARAFWQLLQKAHIFDDAIDVRAHIGTCNARCRRRMTQTLHARTTPRDTRAEPGGCKLRQALDRQARPARFFSLD